MDVRGRGELLSRFFRETFATTLEAPETSSAESPLRKIAGVEGDADYQGLGIGTALMTRFKV